MKKQIRVGITTIGSGIGQSVISSCRLSELPLYTVGLGANPMAYGAYDCDRHDELPRVDDPGYMAELIRKCREHRLAIVVPGWDSELNLFAHHRNSFLEIGTVPLVASLSVIELCRDKLKMGRALGKFSNLFARTYTKEEFNTNRAEGSVSFPLIAKPRNGSGSSGIMVILGPEDMLNAGDNQIFQEIVLPHSGDVNRERYMEDLNKRIITQVSEISVQYVVGKTGIILGKCATCNTLKQGVPIEIVPFDHASIWNALDPVIQYLVSQGLQGPINIQGRITDHGPKFFELNPRFTGITGLRAMMGFNEVEALIRDFLEMGTPRKDMVLNPARIGLRQVADRVVQYEKYPSLNHAVAKTISSQKFQKGKTVMLTGATGFLGRYLVEELIRKEEIETVVCLVKDLDRAKEIHEVSPLADVVIAEDTSKLAAIRKKKVKLVHVDQMKEGLSNLGSIDLLIHGAFARQNNAFSEIAESLRFSEWILKSAASHQVPAIINISSQAVYGQIHPPLWTEDMVPAPETSYGASKWAVELIAAGIARNNKQVAVTSIRLSRIIGIPLNNHLNNDELLHRFMKAALMGEDIVINGGTQTFDLLSVRDAAKGITSLLGVHPDSWLSVYNLGSGRQTSITDIADVTNRVARSLGRHGSHIEITNDTVPMHYGMNIRSINDLTGWRPEISLGDSLHKFGLFLADEISRFEPGWIKTFTDGVS
ncbi:MAG TPA: NAD-dependent epimerase/dehydratase family protein [Candidatus Limnocylindrales bacterium]|nr:NAD-dependent epimerase/dehydratase family protein [Candidatus Limnocylindrales bacterium]